MVRNLFNEYDYRNTGEISSSEKELDNLLRRLLKKLKVTVPAAKVFKITVDEALRVIGRDHRDSELSFESFIDLIRNPPLRELFPDEFLTEGIMDPQSNKQSANDHAALGKQSKIREKIDGECLSVDDGGGMKYMASKATEGVMKDPMLTPPPPPPPKSNLAKDEESSKKEEAADQMKRSGESISAEGASAGGYGAYLMERRVEESAVVLHNRGDHEKVSWATDGEEASSLDSLVDSPNDTQSETRESSWTGPRTSDESTCALCETAFTFFNRRHHCRRCASAMCATCSSPKRVVLPLQGFRTPVRVCLRCAEISDEPVPLLAMPPDRALALPGASPGQIQFTAKLSAAEVTEGVRVYAVKLVTQVDGEDIDARGYAGGIIPAAQSAVNKTRDAQAKTRPQNPTEALGLPEHEEDRISTPRRSSHRGSSVTGDPAVAWAGMDDAIGGRYGYSVPRRYSDFVFIQKELTRAGHSPAILPPLPPQHTHHVRECRRLAFFEDRRLGLETWLNACLQHPILGTSPPIQRLCHPFWSVEESLDEAHLMPRDGGAANWIRLLVEYSMLSRKASHLKDRAMAQGERRAAHNMRKMAGEVRLVTQAARRRERELREPWLDAWSARQSERMEREAERLVKQEERAELVYSERQEDNRVREAESEPFKVAREAHAWAHVSHVKEESVWGNERAVRASEVEDWELETREWRPETYMWLLENVRPMLARSGEMSPLAKRIHHMRNEVSIAEVKEPSALTDERAWTQAALELEAEEGTRLEKEEEELERERGLWERAADIMEQEMKLVAKESALRREKEIACEQWLMNGETHLSERQDRREGRLEKAEERLHSQIQRHVQQELREGRREERHKKSEDSIREVLQRYALEEERAKAQKELVVLLKHEKKEEDTSRLACDGWLRQARDEGETDVNSIITDAAAQEKERAEAAEAQVAKTRDRRQLEADGSGCLWEAGPLHPEDTFKAAAKRRIEAVDGRKREEMELEEEEEMRVEEEKEMLAQEDERLEQESKALEAEVIMLEEAEEARRREDKAVIAEQNLREAKLDALRRPLVTGLAALEKDIEEALSRRKLQRRREHDCEVRWKQLSSLSDEASGRVSGHAKRSGILKTSEKLKREGEGLGKGKGRDEQGRRRFQPWMEMQKGLGMAQDALRNDESMHRGGYQSLQGFQKAHRVQRERLKADQETLDRSIEVTKKVSRMVVEVWEAYIQKEENEKEKDFEVITWLEGLAERIKKSLAERDKGVEKEEKRLDLELQGLAREAAGNELLEELLEDETRRIEEERPSLERAIGWLSTITVAVEIAEKEAEEDTKDVESVIEAAVNVVKELHAKERLSVDRGSACEQLSEQRAARIKSRRESEARLKASQQRVLLRAELGMQQPSDWTAWTEASRQMMETRETLKDGNSEKEDVRRETATEEISVMSADLERCKEASRLAEEALASRGPYLQKGPETREDDLWLRDICRVWEKLGRRASDVYLQLERRIAYLRSEIRDRQDYIQAIGVRDEGIAGLEQALNEEEEALRLEGEGMQETGRSTMTQSSSNTSSATWSGGFTPRTASSIGAGRFSQDAWEGTAASPPRGRSSTKTAGTLRVE